MTSKNNALSLLARNLNAAGDVTTDAIASTVSFGVDVYDSIGLLPYVGNTSGDQAFVSSTNRLYIWQGSGWYNVALINRAPTIASVLDSDNNSGPFALSRDGTATTITITAADSDGDPITYSATADSDFAGLATLSQDSSVFTITPFSEDSASTTSGTITFKATDGVNITSDVNTFTLNFISTLWDETVLSIGTSSTNGLDNSTFIDRSTNTHTVTPTGSPVQTAFHPYLDNWSVEFDGNGDYLSTPSDATLGLGTGDFTCEFWYYHVSRASTDTMLAPSTSNLNVYINTSGTLGYYDGSVRNSSQTVPLNTWSHIAVVRSSSTIKMYYNGTEVLSQANSINYATTSWLIGVNNTGGSDWSHGYISNLRIVKGTAVYTSDFTPPTENLTAISGTSLLTCQSNRFIDNSTNAHTITANGNVAVSAYNPFGQGSEYGVGENKGSAYLDGATLISYDPTAIGTGDFTIEGWFYTTDTTSQTLASDVATNTTNSTYFNLSLNASSQLTFQTRTSNQTITTSTGTAIKSSWNHFIAQRESSVHTIWLNGVRTQGANDGGKNLTKSEIIFGGWNFTNYETTAGDLYFSDIKFSKSAVYSGAGASIALPTESVGNTNAEIYLPMDNAGIFDITSNNTLTLNGVITSTTQTKFADTAIYFDGSNDTIEIANGGNNAELIFNNSNWTMEAWVYKTSAVGGMIFSQASVSTLSSTSNGALQLQIFRGGNQVLFASANNVTNLNTWHHVALTCDGSDYRIWVDGTQVATGAISSSYPWSQGVTTQPFVIGRYTYNNTNYWPGYMENIQLNPNVCKYTTTFTPPTQTQGRTYQAES